jgi:hypothetical protein
MKKPLAISVLCLVALCTLAQAVNITIFWSYPPPAPDSFKVYTSPDLVSWSVKTNAPGTNALGGVLTNVVLSVVAAQAYYYVAPSNFWGEGLPSNRPGTPANVQVITNTAIAKGP